MAINSNLIGHKLFHHQTAKVAAETTFSIEHKNKMLMAYYLGMKSKVSFQLHKPSSEETLVIPVQQNVTQTNVMIVHGIHLHQVPVHYNNTPNIYHSLTSPTFMEQQHR